MPITPPPDPAAIADALKRLAAGHSLADTAVAQLRAVERRLRDAGLVSSPTSRDWAAATLLAEVVGARLAEARACAAAEHDGVAADFAAESLVREAWSCMYYRFVHSPPLTVQQMAAIVRPGSPHGQRLIVRRSALGFRLLAAALIDAGQAEAAADNRRAAANGLDRAGDVGSRPDPANPDRAGDVGSHPDPAITTLAGPDPAHPDPAHPVETLRQRVIRHDLPTDVPTDLPRDTATRIAALPPRDLPTYGLVRIAAWSRPRYALDRRFVALSLLVDEGEEAAGGRWTRPAQRFDALADALVELSPVAVLLGAPGSGKSTLLRRHELDLAVALVRWHAAAADVDSDPRTRPAVPYYVELARYAPGAGAADRLPDPCDWLAAGWAVRYPALPPLAGLLAEGRVVFLLDGLNEMPHRGPADYRRRVAAWRDALSGIQGRHAGNRVVVSCRSLAYSASLSSAGLRVPHIVIDPLDDGRIAAFLEAHLGAQAADVGRALGARGGLDVVRTPFYLKLVADAAMRRGDVPEGPAALLTAMVRAAFAREIERVNPAFDPGPLIAERDYWRVVQAKAWQSPYELPARGALFPALAVLAYEMQDGAIDGEAAQVRLAHDDACRRLAAADAVTAAGAAPDAILLAAEALGVLDDDAGADEVRFVHQRLQEYFAARQLAGAAEGGRVAAPWRADAVEPRLAELLPTLPAGESIPALPQTGWEETTLLAAAMAEDAAAYTQAIAAANLPLAGRCARLPEVRRRLPDTLLDDLRWALVARSRDPDADVRARIDAAVALGPLGDPRFERRRGPHGDYLVPPMVELPGGRATIGANVSSEYLGVESHANSPAHDIVLAPYALGRFALTNAEYACFVAAGGYDDPRWWPTAAAQSWRDGTNTSAGRRTDLFLIWERFTADPSVLDDYYEKGQMRQHIYDLWRGHIQLSREGFAAELARRFPNHRHTLPKNWPGPESNAPQEPVTGISWFEALAYCRWLAAQSGRPFRLPSEVEIEAACLPSLADPPHVDAHGMPWRNIAGAHLGGKTPIGVFPASDTPAGVTDLLANTMTWTSTLWGRTTGACDWPYPYDPADGREALDAPPEFARVIRGAFFVGTGHAQARNGTSQDYREDPVGLRLAR